MFSLSDQQMKIVQQGAALLPVNARDAFLRSVAGRLTDIEILTHTAVGTAVNLVLSTRGVSVPSAPNWKQVRTQKKEFSERYSKIGAIK